VLRRTLIIATCFLLVGFIGWLDYITGFENSLLIFYLAPIAIGTWFLGIGFGIAIAILCGHRDDPRRYRSGCSSRSHLELWDRFRCLPDFQFSAPPMALAPQRNASAGKGAHR